MTEENKVCEKSSEETAAQASERIVTFGADGKAEDEGAAGASTEDGERSAKRKKGIAAVCAAVAVVALLCLAAFVGGAFQTTEEGASAAPSKVASLSASDDGLGSVDEAAGEPDSGDDREAASEQESVDEAARDDSGRDDAVQEDSGQGDAAQPAGADAASSTAQDASSASEAQAGTGAPAASSEAQAPAEPAPAPQEPQEPSGVAVTVDVTSDAVGSPVSLSKSITLEEGATVFDALAASGVDFVARDSAYGKYVAAIGGLAEKEHGGTSGWMYSVNGEVVMTSCSNCVLNSGDHVVWFYTVGS